MKCKFLYIWLYYVEHEYINFCIIFYIIASIITNLLFANAIFFTSNIYQDKGMSKLNIVKSNEESQKNHKMYKRTWSAI